MNSLACCKHCNCNYQDCQNKEIRGALKKCGIITYSSQYDADSADNDIDGGGSATVLASIKLSQ